MEHWSGIEEMFHSLNSIYGSELPVEFYLDDLQFTKTGATQSVTRYFSASSAFSISVYHSKSGFGLVDSISYSQDSATELMDGKKGHRIIPEL